MLIALPLTLIILTFAFGALASFGCGLSHDPTLLNVMRGVQGTGAAAMFATALALIAQEFEGRERLFVAPLAGRGLSRIPAGRIMGTGLIRRRPTLELAGCCASFASRTCS